MPTNFGKMGFGTKSNKRKSSGKHTAPGYKNICETFNKKIASYKTLCGQAVGPAKTSRPSPATLNSFSKLIEKGAQVCKVSPAQVKKWSKATAAVKSPTTAKSALAKCFGKSVIKAVTKDKTGSFLVACAQTVNGKPFNFPR